MYEGVGSFSSIGASKWNTLLAYDTLSQTQYTCTIKILKGKAILKIASKYTFRDRALLDTLIS